MIIQGSSSVFINGLPAARMGDSTVHGGKIVTGCFTVLIGDAGGSSSGVGPLDWLDTLPKPEKKAILQTMALKYAASNGAIFCESC